MGVDKPEPPASPRTGSDRRADGPDPRLVKVERRGAPPHKLLADGHRVFTLEQVAHALQTDVRTVRKLIAIQRLEDAEAIRERRSPRRLGLRVKQMTVRGARVPEAEFDAYLETNPQR